MITTITIDINDIAEAGNKIHQAIKTKASTNNIAVCDESITNGQKYRWKWDRDEVIDAYAESAFFAGAEIAIDKYSGRVARREPGGEFDEYDWSDYSEVFIQCPTPDQAADKPDTFIAMLRGFKYHQYDVIAWRRLVKQIFSLNMALVATSVKSTDDIWECNAIIDEEEDYE